MPKKVPPKKLKISILSYQFLPAEIRIFDLNYFIQVMDKNNRPRILCSDSYGQIFLCINTKNNKQYAIKHMEKNV